jgi:hypothetical protein
MLSDQSIRVLDRDRERLARVGSVAGQRPAATGALVRASNPRLETA